MRPATIAPITERYSSENSVACHEARNAMRPNEIGLGKLVIENLFFILEPFAGLQHPLHSGMGTLVLRDASVGLSSSLMRLRIR